MQFPQSGYVQFSFISRAERCSVDSLLFCFTALAILTPESVYRVNHCHRYYDYACDADICNDFKDAQQHNLLLSPRPASVKFHFDFVLTGFNFIVVYHATADKTLLQSERTDNISFAVWANIYDSVFFIFHR